MRSLVEQRGTPVTHAQFVRFRKAGLLGETDHGRYPPITVDRLLVVRRLSEEEPRLRSLPRRVLYVRRNAVAFPIEPHDVREAMIAVVPAIQRPMHKLGRVDAALAELGLRLAGVSGTPRGRRRPQPSHPAEWIELLNETRSRPGDAADRFTAGVDGWYAWSGMLGPVDSIPPEEQVLLIAILALARDREVGDWLARRSTEDGGRSGATAQATPDPTDALWGEFADLIKPKPE